MGSLTLTVRTVGDADCFIWVSNASAVKVLGLISFASPCSLTRSNAHSKTISLAVSARLVPLIMGKTDDKLHEIRRELLKNIRGRVLDVGWFVSLQSHALLVSLSLTNSYNTVG